MGRDDEKELWPGTKMAWFLGISDRHLRSLVEQKIIKPTVIKHGGQNVRRYDPVETNRLYREYSIEAALKRQTKRTKPASTQDAIELQIKEYTAALRAEQAENQRHKNQVNDGTLIYTADVQEDLRRFFTSLKRFALSIPSRVTGMISGLLPPLRVREVSEQLRREITQLLTTFVVAGEVVETDGKND